MAVDYFLKIDGIPGESTDDKHEHWIEVLSFSHGLNQPASGSVSSGGGLSSQRCDHEDFSIVKTLDTASPILALYCCSGEHIPELIMDICHTAGDNQMHYQYSISNVIVSAVYPHFDREEISLPLEKVEFHYAKIGWTYTEIDHGTGKPKGVISANWDLKANKGA